MHIYTIKADLPVKCFNRELLGDTNSESIHGNLYRLNLDRWEDARLSKGICFSTIIHGSTNSFPVFPQVGVYNFNYEETDLPIQ